MSRQRSTVQPLLGSRALHGRGAWPSALRLSASCGACGGDDDDVDGVDDGGHDAETTTRMSLIVSSS